MSWTRATWTPARTSALRLALAAMRQLIADQARRASSAAPPPRHPLDPTPPGRHAARPAAPAGSIDQASRKVPRPAPAAAARGAGE
jgi:hypothetical protein